MQDKLTIDELDILYNDSAITENESKLAGQLLEVMRENERLQRYLHRAMYWLRSDASCTKEIEAYFDEIRNKHSENLYDGIQGIYTKVESGFAIKTPENQSHQHTYDLTSRNCTTCGKQLPQPSERSVKLAK